MFFILLIIWIFSLTQVFSVVSYQEKPDPQTWLADLRNFIDKKSPTQQIMLILETRPELQDPRIKPIIRALSNLPTHIFSVDHISEEITPNLPSFYVPRSTTIFIMIVPPNNDLFLKISQLTTLVSKLSQAWTRPRCLVIHLTEETSSYKDILHLAWSRQFLDFTLIELTERKNYNTNNSFIHYKKYLNPTLHFFNPFTDLYTTTPFFSGVNWFPNKLQDLNSHKMKIGIINLLPYSLVVRDKLGNPQKTSGTDIKIIQTFSERMNFRIIIPPQKTEDYGLFNCDPEKNTGLLWNLTHNQIQMMGIRLSVTGTCNGTFSSVMRMSESIGFCAVVPILFVETKSFFIRWKFFYAVLLIALILVVIVAISELFHFPKDNWTFTQIVSIILGNSVPREPKKIKERIIFGCLVIACAFYSTNIFAELTHNVFQTKAEREIDTLDELYKSELTPVMHPSLAQTLSTENKGLAKKFVEKSLKTTDNDKCLLMMVRYKNVSCIMRDVAAKLIIEKTRDKCGKAVMKIVKQRLWSFPISFFLEPGSPYIDRFDDLIMKMEESGLVVGWNKKTLEYSGSKLHDINSCNTERTDTINIFLILCWILFSGCLVSFLSFVWEIVKARCVK